MSRRRKAPKADKYMYSSQEIVYSSGWRTEDFRLAEKQRQIERDARKEQNSKVLGEMFGIIEEENIVSLACFVRLIYSRYPQLATAYATNHAQIRDFISSRRFDISCGFTDMPYNKVCAMLKAAQLHEIELEDKVSDLWEIITHDKEDLCKQRDRILELETSLEQSQRLCKSLISSNLQLSELLSFEELPTK